MTDMFSLKGKNAILFGGGGDISIAIAKAFAGYGADVTLYDNSEEHLSVALKELSALDINASTFVGSISDLESIYKFRESYLEKHKTVDIIVNSASVTYRKSFLDMMEDEWKTIVDVNVNGTRNILKAFGPVLCEQHRGKYIQILSTGAYRFGANFVAYGCTKAAQSALIKGLAIEWAPYNIQVNGIAPTATETNFTREYYKLNPEKRAATENNHPYKRLGKPEDYVGAAVYLASEAADFVNGEVIIIDSGKTVK